MIKKKNFKWISKAFKNFLYNFSFKKQFKYREQIRICSLTNKKIFDIHLDDLEIFKNELYLYVRKKPVESLNCFEFIINSLVASFVSLEFKNQNIIGKIQIVLLSEENPIMFKNLNSDNINKLVKVKINVLSISRNKVKISQLKNNTIAKEGKETFCVKSNSTSDTGGKAYYDKKSISYEKLSLNKNNFVDCQIIKAKDDLEKNQTIGCTKHFLFFLERGLVGKLSEGKIVEVMGILLQNNFSVNKERKNLKNQYIDRKLIIHIIGFQSCSKSKNSSYLKKQILFDDDFLIFAKSGNAYDWIVSSILPDFFGNDDVKAGIACLIFGGSINLDFGRFQFNGKINVLLVGNNSDFKEQLFIFIKKIYPLYLEENLSNEDFFQQKEPFFDAYSNQINFEIKKKKLVKKKGIYFVKEIENISFSNKLQVFSLINGSNTTLFEKKYDFFSNNRVSILAGIKQTEFEECFLKNKEKYNLDLRIISNFDLVFSINQKSDVWYNKKIKVDKVNLQKKNYSICDDIGKKNISLEMLRKYLRFVQRNFNPILTKAAADFIKDVYLKMRIVFRKNSENLKKKQLDFTVQQLESIIKISESLSKMNMREKIFMSDALEAVRLFKKRFIF